MPRRWRGVLLAVASASLLLTASAAAATAGEAEGASDEVDLGDLPKPFDALGLTGRADTGGFTDLAGVPYTGPLDGLEGANIETYAVERVDLNKKQAKQDRQAFGKAKDTFGLGDNIKAGSYLVAVIRTAGPADGDVAFYVELNGPEANNLVPGYGFDPRNGNQLVVLAGEFGGVLGAGDTLVAGQALTETLQFYNIASETVGWRKGGTWYILRKLPKGATVANVRSQIMLGNQQLSDVAGDAPTVLGSGPAVPGIRCFSAAGFPGASLDGGPADTNTLQLNFEGDPAIVGGLDLSGLQLLDTSNGATPIDGSPVIVERLGWVSVNFGSIPNGLYQLAAGSAGAEPIAQLLPGEIHFDGQAAGSIRNGLGCGSLVESLLLDGVDPCSFGDTTGIGSVFGIDAAQIDAFALDNPDGSPVCAWSVIGEPVPFAGATYGVRFEADLDLVRQALAACEILELPGDVESFGASCPDGTFQIVLRNPIAGVGSGELGIPGGLVLLRGGNPSVDELLDELEQAIDDRDPEDVEDILSELFEATKGPFGFEAATVEQKTLISEAENLIDTLYEGDEVD